MAKKTNRVVSKARSALSVLIALVFWLTGILVSLAVGFGMASGALSIPFIPSVLTALAGWIVVILIITGALLAIIEKLRR